MTPYENDLNERANALAARKLQHLDIDLSDVFTSIDWSEDRINDAYFARLIASKVLKSADLTKRKSQERKRGHLYGVLGCVPGTPLEFVTAHADQLGVNVNWKGLLLIAGRDHGIADVKRVMRIKNVELDLGFHRQDVDDATQQYFEEARASRPAILHDALSQRAEFDWSRFARAYFKETDDLDFAVIEAVLKKFVHQVRLKLAGRKVLHHLMPVLHGPQGCGKTYLLERMLEPLAEATAWSNFDQVTDDRNVDLWKSLVIVLDEMARANKADVETIKHVITADSLDKRPLYTNSVQQIVNRSVLIGASNHRIDELIKDETGNRRFVELIFNAEAPRDLIDSFDFHALWSSIQPGDADPLEAHRAQLAKAQADYAVKGPVQDWLDSGRADAIFFHGSLDGIATSELYEDFRHHRHCVTAGVDFQSRTQAAFASELRRIVEQDHSYKISKRHTKAGKRWFSLKPRPLTVLNGGRK